MAGFTVGGLSIFFLVAEGFITGLGVALLSNPFMNRTPAFVASMPLMPEWYFLVAVLAVLAVLSLAWSPLLVTIPVFMLAVAATLIQVGIAAAKQPLTGRLSNAWGSGC